jgi:hypothetical protein
MISALFYVMFRMPSQDNALTVDKDTELSGIKKGAVAEEFDITDLKTIAKQKGSTLNDLIMTILSVSMHKYFASKG